MSHKPVTVTPHLMSFATVRQLEYLQAIEQHGSLRAAARALGVNFTAVKQAYDCVKHKAAAFSGHAPDLGYHEGLPHGQILNGISRYVDKDGKPGGYWLKGKADRDEQERILREFAFALSKDVKPLPPAKPPAGFQDEDLLAVYPMGDPHFGMYAWWQDAGENFDLNKADRLTRGAIDRLVDAAPPAATGLLLNLGDMLHADNQRNQTQSGHQLDVDGRWKKVLVVAYEAMLYAVRRMLTKHRNVVLRINSGNHDDQSAFAVSAIVAAWLRDEPRVTVELHAGAYWYYRFGKVLIGSTHGDKAKGPDLPAIMAADRAADWGETVHRHWYVGHVHHVDVKEYRGAVVEYFRTLAARDAWHNGQGYRAGRDMCCIVHHWEDGEVERHRCDVRRVLREVS